jgi:transposase
MRTKNLAQLIIGASGFVLEDITMDAETSEITLAVRTSKHESCRCGICRRKAVRYDRGRGMRRWRCLDIGSQKVYIEAEEPRVFCRKHGVVTASVPWARHNSRFTKAFEETVTWLTVHASHTVVSEFMRVEWRTVGDICERVYDELKKASPTIFNGQAYIGIDETSYKKGHKYMTVVINHETGGVIWCAVGYGKDVLSRFFETLTLEQRASIRCVTADGARWIKDCVEEYCPQAERCVDPFHVVAWATDALEELRRDVWREAYRQAKVAPKRSPGRPSQREDVNPEKRQLKQVRGLRFALLKNPENLTANQKDQLDFLGKTNPALYRGYLLKEGLRLALKEGKSKIVEALKDWMAWAQRCRIPVFRKLREKIKRNFDAIVASAKNGLSNARMEATNNKIKLGIRMAFGFRNDGNMLAMVMLTCSSVQPSLPGR